MNTAAEGTHANFGLGTWPARRARISPERTALVEGGLALTYAALADRTARLAGHLAERGVRSGDRVAYLGVNAASTFETFFATWLLGAIAVPLNYRLSGAEIRYMLADSGAAVLVHSPDADPLLAAAAPLPDTLRILIAAGPAGPADRVHAADPARPATFDRDRSTGPAGDDRSPAPGERPPSGAPGPAGSPDLAAAIAAGPALEVPPAVDPDDPAVLLYTSGTTGRPKAAVLSHANLTWNTINQLAHIDIGQDERALCVSPLFHATGLGQVTLPTFFKGGSVEPVARFDAGAILDRIEQARITSFSAVPTMLSMMCEHPRWADVELGSLTSVVYGGSPVQERVARAWLDRGVRLQQGYGMTEASPGVYMAPASGAADRPVSVGVPHFFTDVAMLRAGRPAAVAAAPGELLVRGPHVFSGYWNRPADSADSFVDGWFRTGDLLSVGPDGWASVTDRVKDLIISGGENVYPAEVEAVLLRLDAVATAAVVGVPDARWGEVGAAYIQPREGIALDESGVRSHLEAHLARYKIPKYVVFVTALPANATGKIRRVELRARAATDFADVEGTSA
ncbi:acyl-CoA synthetase [Embleya scabrispora]|uniref:acyl-CoA synthetase n=1 Tax=Embleya scabrispora TaxID=159449 RepID=UPI000373FC7A|nr:long-chain fatty acid--CoA ligase [Embleya scabrispora]MYS86276.1 AMP-binding protein [Streptomyces sp. SID5474]